MTKGKQNRIEWGGLKRFFHFSYNKWIVMGLTASLLLVYLYSMSLPIVSVFPHRQDYNIEFYTDSASGGHSAFIRKSISDTAIELEFFLNKGFIEPYVGLITAPLNGVDLNISGCNQFHVEMQGQQMSSVGFYLYTLNTFHSPRLVEKEVCFYTNIDISADRKQYVVKLDELKVPDWWYAANHIPPGEKIRPNLKRVIHYNIGTAYSHNLDTKCSIVIHAMGFDRDNKMLVLLLLSIEFFMLGSLVLIYYFKTCRDVKPVGVTVSYQPVDLNIDNRQPDGFLDYINRHFQDSGLSLEQVSLSTGINQRRIATEIQHNFDCNFKTYINQIRINESKRLLSATDLNMGEIAFKVGFTNPTHFSRVFKSIVGITPSEFKGGNN